jgi:hypothetical protein
LPVGIRGLASSPTKRASQTPSLSFLFPDAKGPVLAVWYTGPLVCPEGELLDSMLGGFASL